MCDFQNPIENFLPDLELMFRLPSGNMVPVIDDNAALGSDDAIQRHFSKVSAFEL